jgi:putative aldouronate transport system substrate-binding protein
MAFYFPGKPDVPERQYGVQERMSQNLSKDDSVGLFSSTKDQKAAELESPVWDAMNQMVMGRRSVSEYADVVTTWRENGGAQIAEELATAYENSGIG